MGNNKLKSFRQFLTEEDGMGTVEVILIYGRNIYPLIYDIYYVDIVEKTKIG